MRVISSILISFALLAFTGVAWAQSPSVDASPDRVAVFPLIYTSVSSEELPAPRVRELVHDGAASYLATAGPRFRLVRESEILERLQRDPSYDDGVAIAADWGRLGVEKYRQLDPAGAARDLRHAYDGFLRVGHDFVAPEEVAEVLRFLSLALLEQGDEVGGPLDAMTAMVTLDPDTQMKRGAYPDEVVQFFESASLSLERDLRDRGPDPAPVGRYARLADVRFVIATSVLPHADGGVEMVSWLWDTENEQFRARESIRVGAPITSGRLEQASNRLASRHIAGLVEPELEVATGPEELEQSAGKGVFALQLNVAYASFLRFPDVGEQEPINQVTPFGNVGASIGAGFFLTREFALIAMFQFLNSTAEASGLVVPGFTTLRWFVGGELGVDLARLRLAVAPTLELVAVSSIATCPFGPTERPDGRCSSEPVRLPQRFMVGVNARPRVSYELVDAMDLFVAASGSFFFAPRDVTEVNFLTTGEAGLQYRF